MLKHIPFYASLLGRELADGKKANNGIVLVYGAIEVHATGEKGCIASNNTIAKETGLSAGTVANYISLLNKSGWLRVITATRTGKDIVRESIIPMLDITVPNPSSGSDTLHLGVKPPSSGDETPLHTSVKIDNNLDNSEVTNNAIALGETPEEFGKTEINDLFTYWNKVVGYEVTSRRQQNRNACNNLLKKYGYKGVEQLINAVQATQNDRYAPRISDFTSLQSKLNDLLLWAKKKGTTNATASF